MKAKIVTAQPRKRTYTLNQHRCTKRTLFSAILVSLLLAGCEINDQTGQSAAISRIHETEGYSASGELYFDQEAEGLRISGELTGLSPGQHGLHIHEFGDCSALDGRSAGGHFAPDGNPHGSPQASSDQRHAGDLGNIDADRNGLASINILDAETTLFLGPKAIIGKSVIVHAGSDDLTSQPSGDAGAKTGCGIIEERQTS